MPTALETKLAEFPSAIIDTHGKDLTVSAEPSRQGTPVSSASTVPQASASTPASAASSAKSAVKKDAPRINTATVTVDANFMAAADDLFGLLTDEKRIPAWTRGPAQVCSAFGFEMLKISKARLVCCTGGYRVQSLRWRSKGQVYFTDTGEGDRSELGAVQSYMAFW